MKENSVKNKIWIYYIHYSDVAYISDTRVKLDLNIYIEQGTCISKMH
jgi:hypothetical protein